MKRWTRAAVVTVPVVLILATCATVPVTDRPQLQLVSRSELLEMSFSQYEEFLAEHTVITGTPEAETVSRVGRRIAEAVETHMREIGREDELRDYAWEFRLIDDEQVNAFAMPGGKIAIFSGILPVTEDETGLAVVMGHEVAHTVAGHGNERVSQALLTQLGGMALSVAIREEPETAQNLWLAAYGLGAQVGVLLPYSRLHESEADRLGMIFMAMAGYDPREATDFWQRMAAAREAPSPPEFVATHPSDERRISDLEEALPEAMQHYQAGSR